MKGSGARDTQQRAIEWIEEGIKWMEEGQSLVRLLQGLLDETEQLRPRAGAVKEDPERLRRKSGGLQRELEEVIEVAPEGDLDMVSAKQMRLLDYLDAGKTRIVLDLTGVTYIDSAGLGEVVRAMKRAREVGGDLRICGLGGDVLRIFEITGLDNAIELYPTREEAVASWN